MAQHLSEAANAAGGGDNISVGVGLHVGTAARPEGEPSRFRLVAIGKCRRTLIQIVMIAVTMARYATCS